MRQEVGQREDGPNAGERECRIPVDAADEGVGVRAPRESGVQQSREMNVVDETPGAAQERGILEPLYSRAKHAKS
jgi:hypothetical protein